MNKLLSEKDLEKKLKKYRYFSDEKHICIPTNLFVILFFHKYGGFLSEWEKRICQNEKGTPEIRLKNISGFEYRFPLTPI